MTVTGSTPVDIDQSLIKNSDGTVSVRGSIMPKMSMPEGPLRVVADRGRAAMTTGARKLGCGKTPAASWTFSGHNSNGRWSGSLVACKDYVGKRAFVIDKMWLSVRGVENAGGTTGDIVPKMFHIQAAAPYRIKPRVHELDPHYDIQDTWGCTNWDTSISGKVVSAGISGTVCRGKQTPELPHAVEFDGESSQSYGVKYVGKVSKMSGDATYGIKSLGHRSTPKFIRSQPYGYFRLATGVRYGFDFAINPSS